VFSGSGEAKIKPVRETLMVSFAMVVVDKLEDAILLLQVPNRSLLAAEDPRPDPSGGELERQGQAVIGFKVPNTPVRGDRQGGSRSLRCLIFC